MSSLTSERLRGVAAIPWPPLAAAAAASAAMLGAALFFQYGMGLYPCELCLYQRTPYAAVIVIGGLGALWLRNSATPALPAILLGAACALLFAAGAGIAAFHVGVEQGWWTGTEACVGGGLDTGDIEAMRQAILAAPAVRCDDVTWSLLGISMAGWNFVAATTFTLASGATLLRWRRA